MVRPALLLFALCLIDGDEDVQRERLFAWLMLALGLALGGLSAYAIWLVDYAGQPAQNIVTALGQANAVLSVMIGIAFAVAWLRARGNLRHRIGWIAVAFALAGLSRWRLRRVLPAAISRCGSTGSWSRWRSFRSRWCGSR